MAGRSSRSGRARNLKTKFTNAVIRDGYAYGLDEDVLACIDMATGKRKWMKGRYNHGQVLLVGDLLLVQSETGDVALVEAKPRRISRARRGSPPSTGKAGTTPCSAGRNCWCAPRKRRPATSCRP